MAEINIEKKKKPVWPWILLIILLALIGWAIYEFATQDGDLETSSTPVTTEMLAQVNLHQPVSLKSHT